MRLQRTVLLLVVGFLFFTPARAQADEPEEPDFAFITGGPYTQGKNVIQWISAFNYQRVRGGSPRLFSDGWNRTLRTEWGFTNRWEGDFIFGHSEAVDRTAQGRSGQRGWNDIIAGIRYRLLNEKDHPLTLSLGPQFVAPTSSGDKWTYALDVTAAKDWRGPVFVYSSLNYRLTPNVERGDSGLTEATLQGATWATALALRVFEQESTGGAEQDIHAFLELGGEVEQEFEEDILLSRKRTRQALLLAPGIRWGLFTRRKDFIEFGVSVPLGLNRRAPDWGVIFQLQIEVPMK